MLELHEKEKIVTCSYSPLAPLTSASSSDVDSRASVEAALAGIAAKHKKTVAQLLLQWNLQKGCIVITTTKTVSRMGEMIEALDSFVLDASDMKAIDNFGATRALRLFWTNYF